MYYCTKLPAAAKSLKGNKRGPQLTQKALTWSPTFAVLTYVRNWGIFALVGDPLQSH